MTLPAHILVISPREIRSTKAPSNKVELLSQKDVVSGLIEDTTGSDLLVDRQKKALDYYLVNLLIPIIVAVRAQLVIFDIS
jgi:hypothetical protein